MSGEIVQAEEDSPKNKIEQVFEKMEMMSLHKGDSLDLSLLSEAQKDKLIEGMLQNEDHAFKFHTQKLNNEKEIKLARITAGTISQRGFRNASILIIVACFVITLCFIFFKDQYLTTWLSFITGLAGGYGLSKMPKSDSSGNNN